MVYKTLCASIHKKITANTERTPGCKKISLIDWRFSAICTGMFGIATLIQINRSKSNREMIQNTPLQFLSTSLS